MIKVDGDRLYISCGEACLLMRIADGKLRTIYFGKRVEPEDDIGLLGGHAASGADEFSPELNIALSGKTNAVGSLVFARAEIVDKPHTPLPSAKGQALKITLNGGGLIAELYYIPFVRGGFSRMAVIKNISAKPVKIKSVISGGLSLSCGAYLCDASGERGINDSKKIKLGGKNGSFITARSADACERFGDCYGFYMMYGGDYFAGVDCKERTSVSFGLDLTDVELKSGESFYSPELLTVYSDSGNGGLMRAVHDILREEFVCPVAGRLPVSLCLKNSADKTADYICACVENAGALGMDAFIIEEDAERLDEVFTACASRGLRSGVYGAFGLTEDTFDGVFGRIKKLYERGARLFVFEKSPDKFDYMSMLELYALARKLKTELPEAHFSCVTNGGVDLGALGFLDCFVINASNVKPAGKVMRALLRAVPPCALGGYIDTGADNGCSPKSRFDICSLGHLSYFTDPENLSDGEKRAIRAQIFSYQDDSASVSGGDLYMSDGGFMLVSKDKSKAYAVFMQNGSGRIKPIGIDEHNLYNIRELGKTFSGAAIVGYGMDVSDIPEGETVSFHIRQVADYE